MNLSLQVSRNFCPWLEVIQSIDRAHMTGRRKSSAGTGKMTHALRALLAFSEDQQNSKQMSLMCFSVGIHCPHLVTVGIACMWWQNTHKHHKTTQYVLEDISSVWLSFLLITWVSKTTEADCFECSDFFCTFLC